MPLIPTMGTLQPIFRTYTRFSLLSRFFTFNSTNVFTTALLEFLQPAIRGYRPIGLPISGEGPRGAYALLCLWPGQGNSRALGGVVPRPTVAEAVGAMANSVTQGPIDPIPGGPQQYTACSAGSRLVDRLWPTTIV